MRSNWILEGSFSLAIGRSPERLFILCHSLDWSLISQDEVAALLRESYEQQAEMALSLIEEMKKGEKDIENRHAIAPPKYFWTLF